MLAGNVLFPLMRARRVARSPVISHIELADAVISRGGMRHVASVR